MKNNKNNKLIIIIIALIVLIIAVGVYIVYDKVIKNESTVDNSQLNNNQNSNNELLGESSIKIDDTKDWTYDANYNLPTDKESYYGYSDHSKLISAKDLIVPYINIDSDDAKIANQEIYNLYEELITKFNNNLKDEIWFTVVQYKTNINKNVVSILITTETAGTSTPIYKYYTYNFDITNGNLLTYEEIYKITGFSEDNIDNRAIQAITNTMKKEYPNNDDFDTYNNKSIDNYKKSVDNNEIQFYIDETRKLNIIVTLNIPAGDGKIDQIITID